MIPRLCVRSPARSVGNLLQGPLLERRRVVIDPQPQLLALLITMSRHLLVSIVPIALALLLGCKQLPENRHQDVEQFPDVPVPLGLELDTSAGKSFSMLKGSYRHGKFIYKGDATVERVMAFIQRRMPMQGWILIEDQSDDLERQLLRYEKEENGNKELLDVTVEGKTKLTRLLYLVRRR